MDDPLATTASTVTVARGALDLLAFLKDRVKGADIISALFNAAGERTSGDARIVVRQHLQSEGVWYYETEPIPDYTLIPMAVHPETVMLFGKLAEAAVASDRYFRWVGNSAPGRLYGGEATNVAVGFLVVGFRPDALRRYLAG